MCVHKRTLALILAPARFGIASKEQARALEKEWTEYRKWTFRPSQVVPFRSLLRAFLHRSVIGHSTVQQVIRGVVLIHLGVISSRISSDVHHGLYNTT